MKKMDNIEKELRTELLQVFGFDSVDEIQPEDSFINDLGADSLDFVEILYVIEKKFGVKLSIKELLNFGHVTEEQLFDDDKLSQIGVDTLQQAFPDNKDKFYTGMTKLEMFSLLTVRNLSGMIYQRMNS